MHARQAMRFMLMFVLLSTSEKKSRRCCSPIAVQSTENRVDVAIAPLPAELEQRQMFATQAPRDVVTKPGLGAVETRLHRRLIDFEAARRLGCTQLLYHPQHEHDAE